MNYTLIAVVVVLAISSVTHADAFGTGANEFNIDFVTIGDPGNPPNTEGVRSPAGAVEYVYRIGKYEISEEMVDKANAEGGLGIAGAASDLPMSVSWNEAARFVNWLNTSEGHTAAYKFVTQPGDDDYDATEAIGEWGPSDLGFDGGNVRRNSLSQYFLPSLDEWHKAAYYDPGERSYWEYAVGSNELPTAVAEGTAAGTAVYSRFPAPVTRAGGLSPFGTMAQDGNALEWVETPSKPGDILPPVGPGEALAVYDPDANNGQQGCLLISANGVVNVFVESASGGFTPGGTTEAPDGVLVTDNENRVGLADIGGITVADWGSYNDSGLAADDLTLVVFPALGEPGITFAAGSTNFPYGECELPGGPMLLGGYLGVGNVSPRRHVYEFLLRSGGFRVASVPEPSVPLLASVSCTLFAIRRRSPIH